MLPVQLLQQTGAKSHVKLQMVEGGGEGGEGVGGGGGGGGGRAKKTPKNTTPH
jgi:hypothetical protein